MPYVTRVNPPNDFWLSLSAKDFLVSDFEYLQFPNRAKPWLEDLEGCVDEILKNTSKDLPELTNFIRDNLNVGKFRYVKTHPENEPNVKTRFGKMAFYISFGDEPDSIGCCVNIRIDQDWRDFDVGHLLPKRANKYLKKIDSMFSGMIIGSLEWPPIILPQAWLGKTEYCYRFNGLDRTTEVGIATSRSVREIVDSMYLLSTDYWGVASLLNQSGEVIEWNENRLEKFQGRMVAQSLQNWLKSELEHPFSPRRKPTWVEQSA